MFKTDEKTPATEEQKPSERWTEGDFCRECGVFFHRSKLTFVEVQRVSIAPTIIAYCQQHKRDFDLIQYMPMDSYPRYFRKMVHVNVNGDEIKHNFGK